MTQSATSLSGIMPLLQDVFQQSYPASTLYVVATPIGNVGDITLRALQILSMVDAVACEDTRNTAHLLARYGLSKPLIAAHQHNEREIAERLIARLRSGERIALVSDAGTPGVSDPGARIVDAVIAAGLRVSPVPGASAAIAALSASGLIADQFLFVGFLPAKAKQREVMLSSLRGSTASLIIYEAPHRIAETVKTLAQLFEPARQIVFAREVTKLFEEIHRCKLSQATDWLDANLNRQKGEFVIVIESMPAVVETDMAETDRILTILLSECSVKQAASLASQITGQKKNMLYQRALQIKESPSHNALPD